MEQETSLRIYLAGSICAVRGSALVPQSRLPGRQGRLAFAMLVADRERALSPDELAEQLWSEKPPRAWDTALRAIVSKLRSALGDVGLAPDAIGHALGCYQLLLPAGAWVDLEAADDAVHRAEAALRAGRRDEANGWALVANAIARRPFLAGEDGSWATRRRDMLRDVRVRALECRSAVCLEKELFPLAARDAELVLELEPFRETAYRLLMRAHTGAGNPAEALRVYGRCRGLMQEELGVSPSPETQAVYLGIIRTG
ncbi:MAG: AfsR/SARP family transcriptional regulator [Actinomycetota bacterium]